MSLGTKTKSIDTLILCGGKGERLRSIVSDRPKPMATFGNEPFLSMLMKYASGFGFRRFILSTGFMKEKIQDYYNSKTFPWQILYSEESEPLGTGGAVKKALELITGDFFLVMNGDSFCRADLSAFVDFHLAKKASASVVLVENADKGNCASLILDSSGRIVDFKEKTSSANSAWLNAGIYMFEKKAFSLIDTSEKFSLEYDFFPRLITKADCFGFKQDAELVDIGTVPGYKKAQNLFSND